MDISRCKVLEENSIEDKGKSKFRETLSADFVKDVSHLDEGQKLIYYLKRTRRTKDT